METSKIVLGPEYPNMLTSIWNLLHTWKSQGQSTDIIELLLTCVEIQCQKLSPSYPDIISAIADLKNWQTKSNNQKCNIITKLF